MLSTLPGSIPSMLLYEKAMEYVEEGRAVTVTVDDVGYAVYSVDARELSTNKDGHKFFHENRNIRVVHLIAITMLPHTEVEG